ncbi:hypothetical protein [Aeromicrobium sp. UC242_57]|uniref:protein kinase domain-containing protein n=1 Tax=Aeromicrobium sp. UC242_57 TaxID=3374624 RepID=UPI0037A2BA7C
MDELLNGRYALGDSVGSGGMGAVYRATDTRLGRQVAVKVLRGGPLTDDVARARMRSEASLAASINHRGVAQVYDFEEDRSAHGGLTFIVMESSRATRWPSCCGSAGRCLQIRSCQWWCRWPRAFRPRTKPASSIAT